MRTTGVHWGALLCALFAVNCGGDDEANPPTTSGGSAGTAGTENEAGSESMSGESGESPGGSASGGSGGSGGSLGGGGSSGGGTAGAGGTPEPAVEFTSKPAGVELVVEPASAALGFTLRSSNISQKPSGGSYYKEWFGEVVNGSDETQCFIQVAADFQNAAGTSLLKLDTYAYGSAFELGTLNLSSTCAAPGETVPLWSNALDAVSVPIDSIKTLSVEIVAMARPTAVLHPSTPALQNPTKALDPQLNWWNCSGTASAVADIYNVKLEFWGKSGGVIVGKSAAFHAEDFLEGDSWAFSTIAGISSPTLDSFKSYFSFINGKESSQRIFYKGEAARLVAVRNAAQLSWKAAEDRYARSH